MPIVSELAERVHHLDGVSPGSLLAGGALEMPPGVLAFFAPIGSYAAPDVDVHELVVSGPHGAIPVRIYRAGDAGTPGPGLVWGHGGAFVVGDLDMPEADVVARELCVRAGATVISVDYRLARDGVHFPVPHDDFVAAWRWALGACGELGIDPARLSLGGASAGGNLAAGTALRLRDEGGALPNRLLLAYPMLHYELPAPTAALPQDAASLPPMLRFVPQAIAGLNHNYLGGAEPTPYAFPALGELAGMPPVSILTCEYDDLRASADAFARALDAAGVPVTVRCEPGVPHGHLNIPGLAAADQSLRFLADALRSEAGLQ